jgi:hypothetical protein
MSNYINKFFKAFILSIIFFYSLTSFSTEKSVTYNCTGLSQFELIGSSGIKEEVKSNVYSFIDGVLQDLNNIKCNWDNSMITCESNFLNIRKLTLNQETNEISDFLSGNKGFGVYVDNFKGICEKID